VNGWLWIAAGLVAALVPLAFVAVRGSVADGLVALELAGTLTCGALLLISEGTNRQPFADLAVVLAVMSVVGGVAFLRFLERVR
jgi:multisubunit Na+/H+ antiporter MnhF subunit